MVFKPRLEKYSHKEPNQLDIAEAALPAGLIQRPSYLSPYKLLTAPFTAETKSSTEWSKITPLARNKETRQRR